MFKKKSPQNNYDRQPQNISKVSQVNNGVEARLQSIINNNSKILIARQQQARTSHKQQPPSFFSKYSNKSSIDNSKISHKKQSIQSSYKNIIEESQPKAQNKNVSFQNQLKGLIKIIYQKQKEIQKLKVSIKQANQKVSNSECKRCMGNEITQSMEELQKEQMNLNINDIKETTSKIIQLEAKQSQLHQIIDFLVKKEEQSNKRLKQLSLKNKQLIVQNSQLTKRVQQHEKTFQLIEKQQNEEQAINKQKLLEQIQILKDNIQQKSDLIKQRDEQILKLNSDILKIVHSARNNQNQMSQKITLLIKENQYMNTQYKQLQVTFTQKIERVKLNYQNQLKEAQKYGNQLKETQECVTQLQRQINERKIEIQTLKSKMDQYQKQNTGLQYELRLKQELKKDNEQKQRSFKQINSQLQLKIQSQQKTINQLQTKNTQSAIELQSLHEQINLLNKRLQQTYQSTTVQTNYQYNQLYTQLLEQIRLNSTNKATIEEYKKLLDKIQNQNHLQQLNHQKEIKQLQQTVKSLKNQIINNSNTIQKGKKNLIKENQQLLEENQKLKLQINKLQQSELQYKISKEQQVITIKNKLANQKQLLKINYEEGKRVLQQQLALLKQSHEILQNQLKFQQYKYIQVTDQVTSLRDQLDYEENYSKSILAQLEDLTKSYQKIKQNHQQEANNIQEIKRQLSQNSYLLIQKQQKITQLQNKLTLFQSLQKQSPNKQRLKYYEEESLQIDIQCQKCHQLEHRLKQYELKLDRIEHTQPDQIISLPTIGNLSNIDQANSSFQCKLEDLVQFSSRHFLEGTPKTLKDLDNKKKTTTLIPLQENSLEEDSSYVRYQQEVIKEIQRQCNQPTEIFLGRGNDRTKMVELSEIKQSLKMTKQVNFQLFQEINRQQKIINQFKNVIRSFVQIQKQSQSSKIKLSQQSIQSQFSKLQNLLSIK